LDRIWKEGGLTPIADMPQSDDLIERLTAKQKEISHVVMIVDYLLRSHAHPEDGIRSTIEDAKGFVWAHFCEWGVSKISQTWETYKLTAPYLYAMHLERSARLSKIEGVDSILDWAMSFAKNTRRVERFLGRAAFAMDVLKMHTRDQRERDFVGIIRIAPPLHHFTEEEKAISASIHRDAEDYGTPWS
jgi:hypothetical protein